MGGIPRYLLYTVENKDGLNMENEEESGIYEGGSGMYEDEFIELESSTKEAMAEK